MTPEARPVTKTVLNKIILKNNLDRKWTNIIIWARDRAISVQQLRITSNKTAKASSHYLQTCPRNVTILVRSSKSAET
jgi:hypothetical protein